MNTYRLKGFFLVTVFGLMLLAVSTGFGSWKGIFLAVMSGIAYGSYVISLDKASYCIYPKQSLYFMCPSCVPSCICSKAFLPNP